MAASFRRRLDPARLGSLALGAAIVGLLAGLVAATFATIAAEPAIDDAIAIEEANAAAGPASEHAGDDEASVDRSHQRVIGLFAAYGLTGAAFGAILALTAHAFRHRRPDPSARVLLAGSILAGALTVAPWLKYPPNPPAVGDPDTLANRQALYVLVVCIAVAVGVAAANVSMRLRHRGWPDHRRVAVVAAVAAIPMLVVLAAIPGAPDGIGVPADLVWRFRLASLGANLTLWAVLTFGVAWLAGDAHRRTSLVDRVAVATGG